MQVWMLFIFAMGTSPARTHAIILAKEHLTTCASLLGFDFVYIVFKYLF